MATEQDSWLTGIGVNANAFLQTVAAVAPVAIGVVAHIASTLPNAAPGAAGTAKGPAPSGSTPPAAELTPDEKVAQTMFGDDYLHAYQQAKADLAHAHEIYQKTGKIVPTKAPFAPIEIKEGKPMTRAERYDAMLEKQAKAARSPDDDIVGNPGVSGRDVHDEADRDPDDDGIAGNQQVLSGDVANDANRDPDYLTKQEFHDEFWARQKRDVKACSEQTDQRPNAIENCQLEVDKKYGGEAAVEHQKEEDAKKHRAYQAYQEKVDNVTNSGPLSLAGRAICSPGGEELAEKCAEIGGMLDTAGGTYAMSKAGGGEENHGAGSTGTDPEMAEHREPPSKSDPAETMPSPPPTAEGAGGGEKGGGGGSPPSTPPAAPRTVTDAEVVATNAKNPASIKPQDPHSHQQNWEAHGGKGAAPSAYRDPEGNIRVSTDHVLLKPATRAGIPPVTSGGTKPVPKEAKPAPARPATPAKGDSSKGDMGGAATAKPPQKPQADPLANTPAAPVPAPKPPADPKVSPQAPTGAAGEATQKPQAPKMRKVIDPPQAISEDAVQRIQSQPPTVSTRKGAGSSVRYTVDHDHHQLAWQRLGGHGEAPPAFIYDGQVYLDPSRLPPK